MSCLVSLIDYLRAFAQKRGNKTLNFAFQIALQALAYLPYVIQSVVSVEQAMGSAPGATKLQMVLNAVGAVAGVGGQLPNSQAVVISKLIGSVVNDLNASGIFTHKIDAPKAAAAVAGVK